MAKKKKAGVERPYTWYEFLSIIRNIVEEQKVIYHDQLDYFSCSLGEGNKPIDLSVWDWHIVSETDFGGCEGIYTDFYTRTEDGKRRPVFVAKTLYDSDDAYIAMHEFAALVCLIIRRYIMEHEEEFNWSGYDVGYWKGDKRTTYMTAHKYENAVRYANELKEKGERAWIRNNATREYEEV